MYARFHDNAGLTSRHILSYLPVTNYRGLDEEESSQAEATANWQIDVLDLLN